MTTLHPAQQAIHNNPARFRVCCLGRGFGATTLGLVECLEAAFLGKRAAFVTPHIQIAVQYASRLIGEYPGRIDYAGDRTAVMFAGGGSVVFLDSTYRPQTARGVGEVELAVLDGCERMPELIYRGNFAVNRALFCFTPPIDEGHWVRTLYGYGLDDKRPDWASHSYSSGANPYLPPDALANLWRSMSSVSFRQQILAEMEPPDA